MNRASSSSSGPISARAETQTVKNKHGIDAVILTNEKGNSAQVSLYGGQVISWKTELDEELLFTSTKAVYKPPTAIRGGIPLCFPQVGNRGNLEQHGFARNKMWVIDENAPPLLAMDSIGKVYTDLLLTPSNEDLKIWPHSFEYRLRVSLGTEGHLYLISRIRNVDSRPFSFSFAYRTYLAVSDISEVRIEGLETLDYLDNLKARERFTDQGNSLTFEGEIDRVYVSTSKMVAVLDHDKKRTIVVRKDGLPDVVVWNPWDRRSKAIPDFGDNDYKKMVCVDAAAIENPITLKPGEEWTGRLELALNRSS